MQRLTSTMNEPRNPAGVPTTDAVELASPEETVIVGIAIRNRWEQDQIQAMRAAGCSWETIFALYNTDSMRSDGGFFRAE
jgi:hypothetical protein